MTDKANKIAIIGGGVSGLAVAYHLIIRNPTIEGLEIEIFERTGTLGGNADTVEVLLGRDYARKGRPDFPRPADLGVNDINESSYVELVKAMRRIQFEALRPLEDTISYFTQDGSVIYTDDKFYRSQKPRRIVDERFNLQHVRPDLAQELKDFMKEAAKDVQCERDKYRSMTVADYVRAYSQGMSESRKAVVEELAESILYPRIAAMYFVDERGPDTMPIVAVMEYYNLQEGYGQKKPAKRMYFEGGSQKWIDYLHAWLQGKHRKKADEKLPKVKTQRNFPAKVVADETGAYVFRAGERGLIGLSKPERFDMAVFACHADDALRSFGPKGSTDEIATMLGKVSYANSIAVCHTFTGVLPPHRDTWRTYNVLIRKGAAMTPYSMTYVINRHQNDYTKGSKYFEPGLPQYFVTLNPAVRIPDEYVLPTTPKSTKARALSASGYMKSSPSSSGNGAAHPDSDKAIGWFKHNVLDFSCLEAQEMLADLQGGEFGNVYFTGGWTRGAGLHEQCWVQGRKVVKAMFS